MLGRNAKTRYAKTRCAVFPAKSAKPNRATWRSGVLAVGLAAGLALAVGTAPGQSQAQTSSDCSAQGLLAAGSIETVIDGLFGAGIDIALCADVLELVFVDNLFILTPENYQIMLAAARDRQGHESDSGDTIDFSATAGGGSGAELGVTSNGTATAFVSLLPENVATGISTAITDLNTVWRPQLTVGGTPNNLALSDLLDNLPLVALQAGATNNLAPTNITVVGGVAPVLEIAGTPFTVIAAPVSAAVGQAADLALLRSVEYIVPLLRRSPSIKLITQVSTF